MIQLSLFGGVVLIAIVAAPPAAAQPHVYVSATTAVDAGERGNIPGKTVPSIGVVIGLGLSDAWGVELEIDRGFMTAHVGSGEGVLISFPPSRNPTRQEIELYGIRTRDERTQTAGPGWAAHARWRRQDTGRVNVGLLAGLSSRVYETGLVRTTTFVSPLLDLSPSYRLPDEQSIRRMVGWGVSGGLTIPVRITPQLALEPEVRVAVGFITNDRYRVLRAGLRMTWSF